MVTTSGKKRLTSFSLGDIKTLKKLRNFLSFWYGEIKQLLVIIDLERTLKTTAPELKNCLLFQVSKRVF